MVLPAVGRVRDIHNWDFDESSTNISQILLGGSAIGQATMTRFYSLHFGISLIALVVSELYFYKHRYKRINLNRWAVLLFIAMLVFVSIVLPAEMGSRANPEVTPLPILSDWYFLALYQLLKYMDPYWATLWTVGIPFMTIALAFLDFGPEKDPWRRPIFSVAAIIGFIDFVAFSALIIANIVDINRDPPYWYAQMIVFMTIAELWHFGIYKQLKVWLWWALPNLLLSGWYVFLYVIPKPNLPENLTWFYANDPKVHPADLNYGLTHHPFFLLWLGLSFLMVILSFFFARVASDVSREKAIGATAA